MNSVHAPSKSLVFWGQRIVPKMCGITNIVIEERSQSHTREHHHVGIGFSNMDTQEAAAAASAAAICMLQLYIRKTKQTRSRRSSSSSRSINYSNRRRSCGWEFGWNPTLLVADANPIRQTQCTRPKYIHIFDTYKHQFYATRIRYIACTYFVRTLHQNQTYRSRNQCGRIVVWLNFLHIMRPTRKYIYYLSVYYSIVYYVR